MGSRRWRDDLSVSGSLRRMLGEERWMIPHRSEGVEGVCSHDLGRVVADQFVGSLQFARRVGCVVVDAVIVHRSRWVGS